MLKMYSTQVENCMCFSVCVWSPAQMSTMQMCTCVNIVMKPVRLVHTCRPNRSCVSNVNQAIYSLREKGHVSLVAIKVTTKVC